MKECQHDTKALERDGETDRQRERQMDRQTEETATAIQHVPFISAMTRR